MRKRHRAPAMGVFFGLSAAVIQARDASAAIMPYTQLDQTRSIEVSVSAKSPLSPAPVTDGARETSDAIGSFSRSMQYAVTQQDPPPDFPNGGAASGSARQDVVFGETSIFGTVAAEVNVSHSGGRSSGLADSQFLTHFTVTRDTPFTLAGQISLGSGGLGTVGRFAEIFLLTGQGPEPGQTESFKMIGIAGGNGGGAYPLDATGVFHPGWVYLLSVQLMGEKTTEGTVGAQKEVIGRADFALTVPEPGATVGLGLVAAGTLLRRRRRPDRYSSVGVRKK